MELKHYVKNLTDTLFTTHKDRSSIKVIHANKEMILEILNRGAKEEFEGLSQAPVSDFVLANLSRHATGSLDLPQVSTEVRSVTDPQPYENEFGVKNDVKVTMDNGTRYDVTYGRPKHQASDTAAGGTVPLLVPLKHSHNVDTTHDLMELGFPTIMVGHPMGWRANNNLANTAHDMHRIFDLLLPRLDVKENQIFGVGGSRGANAAIAMTVERYANGRFAPYLDVDAVCGSRPPKTSEIPEVLMYGAEVALRIGANGLKKMLKQRDLSEIKNLISEDPAQGFNAGRSFVNHASGIVGKMAIASDPRTHMHIQLFESDKWTPIDPLHVIFQDRPNVTISIGKGGHEMIPHPQTRENRYIRFSVLRELRGYDGVLTHEDYLEVSQAHRDNEDYVAKTSRRQVGLAA